jgi:hypothetical protein
MISISGARPGAWRRAPLALAAACALIAIAGMPGGMGGGFGSAALVVFFGFLGLVIGYVTLLFTSISRALSEGPHRVAWRVAAIVLLAVLLLVVLGVVL